MICAAAFGWVESQENTSTSNYTDSYATDNSNQTSFSNTRAVQSQPIEITTGMPSSTVFKESSGDAVAGIVVLSILIILLVAGILFYILRRQDLNIIATIISSLLK